MASNPRYIGYPLVVNARDLMQRAFNYLQAKMPGWQPSEGQLEVWMIEGIGGEAADIATLTTEVPKSIFRYYGAKIFGILPVDAAPALITSTWFLTDNLGHTISAGTQVGIYDGLGNLLPFAVLSDVIVPAGSAQTAVGGVTLLALVPGAASSGIGGAAVIAVLLDTLAWIDHISLTGVTTGGQDAETDDDYLSRLAIELQTMSPRPILPNDFAILARNVVGSQRWAAIDGYNPADGTFNNQRMVALAGVDINGAPVSAPVKTAAQAYLAAMREINFVVNTIDPSVSQIDVTTHVNLLPGYQAADVASRIVTAVRAYLSPVNWGMSRTDDPNDPQTWSNQAIIRYDDLVTIVRSVAGVNYIIDLTVGIHGGAMSAADLNLGGIVPLPNPNTLTAVAS